MKIINMVAIISLCAASVISADIFSPNIVLDITDPDNVTITNFEKNGTYGGQLFAIDGLEFYGPTAELVTSGPMAYYYPDSRDFGLGVVISDGALHAALSTSTVWMEYGRSYNLGPIVTSSNPADYYAMDGDTYYAAHLMISDSNYQNGFGSAKFLVPMIPEPASMSLLAMGALAILRRRRS